MIALVVSVVLLWLVFYCVTLMATRRIMRQQAVNVSEQIISDVEEELLALEEAALELSADPGILKIAGESDVSGFYAAGADYIGETRTEPFALRSADHVVVYDAEGRFFRVKGTIPNTALERAFWLMENSGDRIVTVTSNDTAYIGPYEALAGGGYVALLMERTRLERLLGSYNDLDYIGAALFAGGRLLCTNRNIREEEIGKLRERAVFYKEKEIGLSGYRLLVWSERGISRTLTGYFSVAMPATIICLVVVMFFFVRYIRRRFVSEAELEKERTLGLLLKKQISAHFTVNTLNAIRALIRKGKKDEAAGICDELSTLLRYANAGERSIPLMEEFFVLEQYIGIMQARYPDTIEAEVETDDAYAEILIPRMCLQPLVENAIRHGLAGGKGRLSIRAELTEKELLIRVKDDGKGMPKERLLEVRKGLQDAEDVEDADLNGIALKNVQRRIRMVCGEDYGLTIVSSTERGTEVTVHLPREGVAA